MFDDVMDPNDAGLRELTRCLEAYADARLSPTAVATINMRANVMNAAHRRAAVIAADVKRQVVAVPAHAAGGERRRVLSRRLYRPAAALMAASLTLALLAGTVYGARAGGPLYGTRLWIEAANLPTSLVARAQAEGVRLDTRIAEAQQASVDGDAPAAEAALAAYSVIVAEALQGTDGDSTADAAIEISISRHVVVLNQLAGTVPAHARGAIEKAIASSSKAIEDLNGQTAPGDDGHAGGPDWLGGAAAPGATESTKPSQDTGPRASAGIDGIAAPGETGTPDKVPSPRDHEVPPGRSRAGGRDETGKSAHPTAAPSGPQGTPAGTQPGGPSAP
jgi:hypothetical protein